MKIYNGIEELPQFKETVVSVGSFDGVHRGHRLLISRMNDLAESLGATSVIVTFDPHPREVLRGNNRLLSTTPEKLILLKEAGAEHVLVINFTQEFSQMPYDRFVKDILRGKLSATNIYVGEGHHFGKEKQGGVDSFESLGIRTHLIERLEGISSTGV
ncbi:MAG: adenylyltransferase/cytidyltransferase family protein, partial [Rikenellaceae bacterium]